MSWPCLTPPHIGKVLKELYYGNVITIVDDAHNCDFPAALQLYKEGDEDDDRTLEKITDCSNEDGSHHPK